MEKNSVVNLPEDYRKVSLLKVVLVGMTDKGTWKNIPLVFAYIWLFAQTTYIWRLEQHLDIQQQINTNLKQLMQIINKILQDMQINLNRSHQIYKKVEALWDLPIEGDSLNSEEYQDNDDNDNLGVKRKREIRDYNESSIEKDLKNATEEKYKTPKSSTESFSSMERSSSVEYSSKEKYLPTSHRLFMSSTRKPHLHRKHRKSRIGSAERFFTETYSTTSAPIQVRQSRTKLTEMNGIDKTLWLQNQKFQQHTSAHKDTITKEEALLKGYGKHLEESGYDSDVSRERASDALSYNMITIHFSADTSHYSRERDPHYFGNGRMQIKSEVYKDWKPAHWTQGVGMSRYFHLHQGRVTVSTTGIYLIYAQIQYSNVQEVNGFSVFRNKEVVVQCITTSTHPDKHEIKSNTCGISTTILLQSNDSICIKDLHHGRYVVLTPERSYFGLVLLSPFKK